MKTKLLISSFVILAFLLSACSLGGNAATPTDAQSAIDAVYTQAAMTLAVQLGANATPTMWPTLESSPTDDSSPTTTATNEFQVVTATAPAAASGGSACDNSIYVSDVTVPDGTVIAPGQAFTKTWKIENSGTCAWTTSYAIGMLSGDSMSGGTTTLPAAVGPGAVANISVAMVAPTTTGNYTSYWRMKNAVGSYFGQQVTVVIIVSNNADTLTPSITATGLTATPTATATGPTSTFTSGPSRTPTITPTGLTATPTRTRIPVITLTPSLTAAPPLTATPTAEAPSDTPPEPSATTGS
jgi:Ig-like domain from next to BRCA1 gene